MRKPIILMSCGTDLGANALPRLAIYRNYAESLNEAGAYVLVITDADEAAARALCGIADGLLLTGGVDVEPARYGEPTLDACGEIDRWRDAAEFAYARAFIAAKKPILGICRGMQVLNVVLGGTLYQDIPSQIGLEHPGGVAHEVDARGGSDLERLFGERFLVNSYHHQAVKALAPGLAADAVLAGDKRIVEAFHHTQLPIAACQWHPERMRGAERLTKEGPDMDALFRAFLDAVEQHRNQAK